MNYTSLLQYMSGAGKGKSVNRRTDRHGKNALQHVRLLRFQIVAEAGNGVKTDFGEDNILL